MTSNKTEDSELFARWYPYAEGSTIGQTGFEGGVIVRDEEYGDPEETEDADSRITLERGDTGIESRILTATLYGWLSETRRFATEADSQSVFDAVKPELARLAGLIPDEADQDVDSLVAHLGTEIRLFVARYFPV